MIHKDIFQHQPDFKSLSGAEFCGEEDSKQVTYIKLEDTAGIGTIPSGSV